MRQQLPVLLAALGVILLGWGGWYLLFADARGTHVVVLEQSGVVELTAANGVLRPLSPGERLAPQDTVRVGSGATAVLGIGEGSSLRLEAATSLRLVGVSKDSVQVELEGGRVQARIKARGPGLQVGSGDRLVLARDADFRAGVDATGTLAVEAERGTVDTEGIPGVDSLTAGTGLIAPRQGDAVQTALTEAMLLEVDWPQSPSATAVGLLEGSTSPYARVRVAGKEVLADVSGHFAVRIPLEKGANDLTVEARDALGRLQVVDRTVLRPAAPPPIGQAEVRWTP
mgnify:CR=1 FL=1